jgi:hypothetical protein
MRTKQKELEINFDFSLGIYLNYYYVPLLVIIALFLLLFVAKFSLLTISLKQLGWV